MSGSTIGGIVGGVIGFAITGTPIGFQVGWMAGSLVGAVVDPVQIEGPRLTSFQGLAAQDGTPITYGDGTFPVTRPCVIWATEPVERRHKDDGKGGPEQITYTYHRSYAILVCKGEISGYKIIKRAGKIVYDARTDAELTALGYDSNQISEMRAAQAKFLQEATLYYGTADQMPDPTITAVKGAGNVPAYTGYAYIVLTDTEGASGNGEIDQFEFVVATCGDRHDSQVGFVPILWDPNTAGGGDGAVLFDGQVWMASTTTPGYVYGDTFVSDGDWYWEHTSKWYRVSGSGIAHYSFGGIVRQSDNAWGGVIGDVGTNGGGIIGEGGLVSTQELIPNWRPTTSNTLASARIRNRLTFAAGIATWQIAIDDGPWTTAMATLGGTFAPYGRSRGPDQDGQIDARRVWLYTVPDDFLYEVPEGALPLGGAKSNVGTPIPDAPGHYIDPETGVISGPHGTTIDPCTPTLGTIVAKQCAKREVTTIDVSELTDPVTGYSVSAPSSPQKNIQALQPGYFFDSSEFDGVLHFPKRGGSDSFSLTVDDLVERDADLIEWERTQEIELLRKVTVGYTDPMTNYTATTQEWERRASTIRAEGEGTIELPIVGTQDWAAQVAHKSGKVAWGENEKCEFSVTIACADLVTAAVGTITDEEGVVHRIRIERIKDEGLVRHIEARRTRADLYQSNADGTAKPLPAFPGSDIRGPTNAVVLNIPAATEAQDAIGIRWAAAGMTSAWAGARLQVQRSGEWVTLGDITNASGMGVLLDDLPAHHGDIDNEHVLRVRFNEPLESVSWINLLRERNPLAIMRLDGTAEIVQFQHATEVATNEFELTKLLRGRLATDRTDHAEGATVVFLDGRVPFVPLELGDVGRTLTFRVVSLGTNPDAATPFDVTLDPVHSSTEFPVAYLEVEQDGDDYHLTWIERRRFGTDENPVRSANWQGFRVRYSHSGGSGEVTVTDPQHTFNLPGASGITFGVSQINRLTGAGPETTVTVP